MSPESSAPDSPARLESLPPKLVPVLLVLVLLLAAALRLFALRDSPHWYSDELFNLNVIQTLLDGEWRVRAVSWTGFSPFHPYPLGYHLLGSVFCYFLGEDVWTVRLLCGLLGVVTTFFLFLIGRTVYDERAGLLAAFAYAIHPKIVLFTRWAFPQNLSPVFVVAALWAGLNYRQTPTLKWLVAFSLLTGGALFSIYWAAPLLLVLLAAVYRTRPRHAPFALGLALAPLFGQLVAATLAHGPGAVFYDLSHLFGMRIVEADAPAADFLVALQRAGEGFLLVFGKDLFFLGGLAGLFLLPVRWHSGFLLAVLGLLAFPPIYQRGSLLSDFYYNAAFFAPIPFVGFGALFARLLRGAPDIQEAKKRNYWRFGLLCLTFAAFGIGWFYALDQTFAFGANGDQTSLDAKGLTIIEHRDAEAAARYLNLRTGADDFVIATSNLHWLLRCRSTDVHQMAALLPGSTIWYPSDLPKERFRYDLDFRKALFFVMDNLTRGFYLTVRNCDEVVYAIHQERWPLMERFGEFLVYANPRFVSSPETAEPILPPELQYRLGELHEFRSNNELAVRWFVRAAEEGGAPIMEKLDQPLRPDWPMGLRLQAMEQVRTRQENRR